MRIASSNVDFYHPIGTVFEIASIDLFSANWTITDQCGGAIKLDDTSVFQKRHIQFINPPAEDARDFFNSLVFNSL